jgi:hypothetical protein
MKFLRLAAFSTLFGCALALSAYTQATQPPSDQNPAAPPTAQTPGAPEPFSLAPAKRPLFQFPTRKPSRDFHLVVQLPRYQETPPQGDFDRGIYVRKPAGRGGESCASIISYNFSPGENPQLESVTTCTSASMTNALRARGKDKKPVTPLFQTTDLKTVSPQ